MFTPIDSRDGLRKEFDEDEVIILDGQLHQRRLGKHARVSIRGELFNVYGRACGLPHCHCDAIIKPVKGLA